MSDLLDAPPVHPIDGSGMLEVQRSLGRIEGMQEQILNEFVAHKRDDKSAFEIINKAFETRDAAIAKLREDQDKKIDALEAERDTARGAGKVILALLAAAATFVGGAVMAVLSGWISVKFKG